MTNSPRPDRVFVLEVDTKAIAAFGAQSKAEAFTLTKEDWLKEDHRTMFVNGTPVYSETSQMRIREATVEETEIYFEAVVTAGDEPDDLVLAYLISTDRGEGTVKPGAPPPRDR